MSRASWLYLGVTGPMASCLPAADEPLRSWLYLAMSITTTVAVASRLLTTTGRDRLPWALLTAAIAWLAPLNLAQALRFHSDVLVALFPVNYVLMLGAAITLVLRRGRDDVGGLLDTAVASMGLSGLLWTTLLAPRLDSLGAAVDQRMTVLITLMVLAAILGTLGRLITVTDQQLPALYMLAVAVACILAANVSVAMITGRTYGPAPGWVDLLYAGPFVFCGLLPLHSSAEQLVVAGPAPVDRLTAGRMAFLGATLCVNPVAVGLRVMAGAPTDNPLLITGVLLMTPMVLFRVGRVVRERIRAEDALRRQATHDQLTGLPNRAELHHRLDDALHRDQPVVLLFGDLNGFKAVNDRLGHVAGDELLVQVGARIQAALPPGDTVFRYGGDEFLILCDDPGTAGVVAEAVAEPFALTAGPARISISIGTVVSDGSGGADELVRRADQAMYRAKEADRVPRGTRVAAA